MDPAFAWLPVFPVVVQFETHPAAALNAYRTLVPYTPNGRSVRLIEAKHFICFWFQPYENYFVEGQKRFATSQHSDENAFGYSLGTCFDEYSNG